MRILRQRAAIILIISALIHLFSRFSDKVDNWYSLRIYPFISFLLRFLTGWIPFSIGDILYPIAIVLVIWWVVRGFKEKDRFSAAWLKRSLYKGWIFLGSVYIIFNLLWGLNYNRLTVLELLGLNQEAYSRQDLNELNGVLVHEVNYWRGKTVSDSIPVPAQKEMFLQVKEAYAVSAHKHPFLKYSHSSTKASLWSEWASYVGVTGYYNPFTAEAQVNVHVPTMVQPFTAAHEIGHQLGFAREDEANFAGFLAAESSGSAWLRYSAYLDMFLYANRNLFDIDSVQAKSYSKQLLPEVKSDLNEYIRFRKRHQSFIEPIFRFVYGKFLEQNQQPQGMLTYNDVIAGLITYYKSKGILTNSNGKE